MHARVENIGKGLYRILGIGFEFVGEIREAVENLEMLHVENNHIHYGNGCEKIRQRYLTNYAKYVY